MDPFIAEIRIVAFDFAPNGWAPCDGQLLPITQNTALFSILGTTFGGDGKTTFALPNIDGSVVMGPGEGAGLSQRYTGETGGEASVTLQSAQIPSHTHTMQAASGDGTQPEPDSLASCPGQYQTAAPPATQMAPAALSSAGSGIPHNNMQPYLVLRHVIALTGTFPPRP